MPDERQRILIVIGDMRPTHAEMSAADIVIKVPLNHTPQVLSFEGPASLKPIVARANYQKPKGWDDV